MNKSRFERAEKAIVFAPIYRQAALEYYQIDDKRHWRELPPRLQEHWCGLANVALAVNKRVIELTFGSPAGQAHVAQVRDGVSEAREKPAGRQVEESPIQQVFSPLRQYQPVRVK